MVTTNRGLPLAGVRVIDFTRGLAGPGTAMYLCDLGADVVRVEPPDGATAAGSPFLFNRGKRSIAVDLRNPQGQAIAHELVRGADVAIVSAEPGGPERLALGYEQLNAINPRIVYAHITGWGPEGPDRMKAGMDYLHQGYTGIMWTQPDIEGTPTANAYVPADMSIPMYLPFAITAALYERTKSGLGQKIETSQLQAQVAARYNALVFNKDELMGNNLDSSLTGLDLKWASRRPHHNYQTKDGKWLVLITMRFPQWEKLWGILELGEIPAERPWENVRERSNSWTPADMEKYYPILQARFCTRTRAEWFEKFKAAGLDEVSSPVNSSAELFEEPQMLINGMVLTQQHPTQGTLRMPSTPFTMSSGKFLPTPAPEYAQHTDEVLAEIGQTSAQIAVLRAAGAIK